MANITASDANRSFSRMLQRVMKGEHITVTSHGKPVAVISPTDQSVAERQVQRHKLLQRLRAQSTTGMRDWTRDDLYD